MSRGSVSDHGAKAFFAARAPIAEAARQLGARRTLVVSGYLAADDGELSPQPFDELSLFGPTDVIDVSAAGVERYRWTAEDFGLATQHPGRLADLEVAGPAESAAAIRGVLAGEPGPRREVVVLNAAAVLYAAGHGATPAAARDRAEKAIDSGKAAAVLEELARLSQDGPSKPRA